jgi:hypothetical protein
MGLHRVDRTPCGFCFVEFRQVASAVAAEKYLNGATLDGRVLKIERDPGFKEGRQYGRARSGGQVRDEIRTTFDAARGGFGALVAADVAANDAATPSGFQPPPQMRMPNPMGGPGPRGRPRFGQSNMMMPIPMGGPSGGMPMGGPSGGMPMGGPSGGMPMGGPSGGMRGRPRPGTTFLARGPMPQMLGPRGEPVMHPMMQVHNGGGGHHGRSDQQHRGGGGDVRFRGAERDRHGGGRGDQRGGGGGDRFGRDRQRPRDDDRDRDRDRDSRSDVDEFGRDQTRRRRVSVVVLSCAFASWPWVAAASALCL